MSKLNLAQANTIIEKALAMARDQGYRAMAVVVLDESGHMRSMQRADGASMFRIEIACAKAWAAVSMGASSRTLLERAQKNPAFYAALPSLSQGRFVAQTGAVVIKNAAGDILGAVGASGGTGDEDEAICIAGVAAAGLSYT
jgi:uncharacterized protein GlcG (DUF336 family)